MVVIRNITAAGHDVRISIAVVAHGAVDTNLVAVTVISVLVGGVAVIPGVSRIAIITIAVSIIGIG